MCMDYNNDCPTLYNGGSNGENGNGEHWGGVSGKGGRGSGVDISTFDMKHFNLTPGNGGHAQKIYIQDRRRGSKSNRGWNYICGGGGGGVIVNGAGPNLNHTHKSDGQGYGGGQGGGQKGQPMKGVVLIEVGVRHVQQCKILGVWILV